MSRRLQACPLRMKCLLKQRMTLQGRRGLETRMKVKVSKQGLLCTKKKTLFFPPSLFLWLNQEVIGIMFTIVDCCVFLFLLHIQTGTLTAKSSRC